MDDLARSNPSEPVTDTPWGPAEGLRKRKLRPGPGSAREDVIASQRERLFGATVAVVAEHGYEKTRVADILEVAGVSRSAFYTQHFEDKRTCFLATLDALIALARQQVSKAYDVDLPWDERLRSVVDMTMRIVVAQPAAARLWFLEVYSAGPEAIDRIERLGDELERIAADALAETPDRAGMPRELIRAVIGGFRQTIQTRLRNGREDELPELASDLLAWALGYRTPPQRLRRPRKPPALPPTTPDPSEQRARIVAAVTEIAAEKGYQAMTTTEIAQRAAVSLSTLYSHFKRKPDAFVAALDDGERRLMEAVLPAYRAAGDWEHAVKDGIHAFFASLALDPAAARLGGLDVYAGGALALARHEASVRRFEELLEPGYEEYPMTSRTAGEAIGGAIASLVYHQVRRKGPERLYQVAPTATFVALAPFTGPERACVVANEGWRPPAR